MDYFFESSVLIDIKVIDTAESHVMKLYDKVFMYVAL